MNGEKELLKLNEKRMSMIAALPALLVCFVLLIELMLDIMMPSMLDKQYLLFPVLVKIAGLAAAVCAAICFSADISAGSVRMSKTAAAFMLFVVLIIASTAVNGISEDAVFGIRYRYVGVYDLLVMMGAYMYCSSRIKTGRMKTTVLLGFISVADLLAIAFLWDRLINQIPAFQGRKEAAAIFFHGNHYGYFLVMAVVVSAGFMLFKSGRRRSAGAFSLALNLSALLIERSMGPFIAAGAVLLAMLLCARVFGDRTARRTSIIIMALFVATLAAALLMSGKFRYDLGKIFAELAGLLSGDNNVYAGNGRWGLWLITSIYITDRPFLGYGCEGIASMLKTLTTIASPHCEPLTYAAFFGIPAAASYLAGVILAIYRGLRENCFGDPEQIAAFAAAAYFLSSLFGVAVFYTAPFFFIMMGLSCPGAVDCDRERNESERETPPHVIEKNNTSKCDID